MIIPTYVTRPLVSKWLQSNEAELKSFLDFIIFNNLDSYLGYIKKNIINALGKERLKKEIVAVDIGDMHIEFIEKIRLLDPDIKIILFDFVIESNTLVEHLRRGYNSVVEIGTKPHELISVVQKLLKQDVSVASDLMDFLLKEKYFNKLYTEKGNHKPQNENKLLVRNMLSEKQQMVYDFLIKGYTYKEISQQLGITFYSVNQRAKYIYKKLGVKSRVELLNLVLK